MSMITLSEFEKVDLRVVKVIKAERVEGSAKLLRLEVHAGDTNEDGTQKIRQIVAGIGKGYDPSQIEGKNIVIIANLEPRMLMGLESNGMVLAASNADEGPVLLTTFSDIQAGSHIR